MKKISLLTLLFLFFFGISFSQNDTIAEISTENNPVEKKSRFTQLTFFYPVGSNGLESFKYSNKISLNMLFGLNGGSEWFEAGGIANINRGNVSGLQAAGLLNIGIKGDTKALQGAGLINFNNGKFVGLQGAGLFNINTKETKGFQNAGLISVSGNNFTGLQASGIANMNNGYLKGVCLGLINIAKDSVMGVQIGLINVTKKLKGVQFGLINLVNDAEKGLPIGLINIVKKGGYREFEMMFGDVLYFNTNLKIGMRKYYTIFKAGVSYYDPYTVLSTGIGIGTILKFGDKLDFSIDLSENYLRMINDDFYNNYDDNYYEDWDNWEDWIIDKTRKSDVNYLTKLDLNFKYRSSEKTTVTVGPSINLYSTNVVFDKKYGTINVPYTLWRDNIKGIDMKMWVGLNLGISIVL